MTQAATGAMRCGFRWVCCFTRYVFEIWSAVAERSGDTALDLIGFGSSNLKRRRRCALPAHSACDRADVAVNHEVGPKGRNVIAPTVRSGLWVQVIEEVRRTELLISAPRASSY